MTNAANLSEGVCVLEEVRAGRVEVTLDPDANPQGDAAQSVCGGCALTRFGFICAAFEERVPDECVKPNVQSPMITPIR